MTRFQEHKWDDAIYRLGNLALLQPAVNREIGNAAYPDKQPAYRQSEYSTTRAIPELAPTEWTLPLIVQRQRLMAARATHLWRSDFAVS